MNETVLANESYVNMQYIPNFGMLYIQWYGSALLGHYQETFRRGFEFITSKEVPFYVYLSDIRKQKVVLPEVRSWVENYAIPEAIKKGLKLGVVIFDGTVFKKYYLNIVMFTFHRYGVPFKFVNSYEEAIEFIEKFCMVEFSNA
ncbi:MAG TPA: hypothetical protein PL017_05325 [Tenuifilaceae bacterium]|nr:hypothetical protein [Tenuifilaceae bacterium]HPE18215.1 hypothetical protein [Tenuifilaceae bacterium]HPJ45498.1 hypothetical protein [Tenuifilaceae bacterium]HPQ33905.1 hypothetical protein [Tenuifilaceae bacterium]HRX68634.1 hypothetical protein [Tenuifilaceae bacterium]